MITVSAPGKVHLIGEHAVVYGEPAIIASVGMRTTVTASKSKNVRYIDERFKSDRSWPVKECVGTAEKAARLWAKCAQKRDFSELFNFIKWDNYGNYKKTIMGLLLQKMGIESGVEVRIKSTIPVGAGLGSSASLGVALAKAVSELYGKDLNDNEVNRMAFELEKVIHGSPSGGDNSACCFGGLVWFQKGQPALSMRADVPYKLDRFVLVHVKEPELTTGELVQKVMNLDENFRSQRVKAIGEATLRMKEALKDKDFITVSQLINVAQKNLSELGVSVPEIDSIAETVRKIGGSAKLCGAGGGGVMLCYHRDKAMLASAIRKMGYDPIETELAVEGVRVESQ